MHTELERVIHLTSTSCRLHFLRQRFRRIRSCFSANVGPCDPGQQLTRSRVLLSLSFRNHQFLYVSYRKATASDDALDGRRGHGVSYRCDDLTLREGHVVYQKFQAGQNELFLLVTLQSLHLLCVSHDDRQHRQQTGDGDVMEILGNHVHDVLCQRLMYRCCVCVTHTYRTVFTKLQLYGRTSQIKYSQACND